MFEAAKQSPIQTQIIIKVPRQSAKSKKSKQKARAKRPMRTAQVSVRFTYVELKPPAYMKGRDPIRIGVINISEDNPPADAEALEWFLLTTIVLKSIDEVLSCVKWSSLAH